MKSSLSNVTLVVVVGCAAPQAPGGDLARICVEDRTGLIVNEWARFESLSGDRVFYPDWRALARQWAIHECSHGRPVATYHPVPDTATARRDY